MAPIHVCCIVLMLSASSAGSGSSGAEEVTYAQRLGWPAGAKVVIFHVDDAGMSYDSNMGAIKALEGGVATSTSVMMPCLWVPQMAAYIEDHPQVDAGVHLTLNAEWKDYRWGPVAGKPAVPDLVDEQGCLWHRVADVAGHASVDEFETEIRAQVDKAMAMGMNPTHLDTHMGTCFELPFVERYLKVGIEKRIPVMVMGGHMQHVGAEAGALKPVVRMLAEKVWNSGLPVLDDLVTQPTTGPRYEQRKQQLLDAVEAVSHGETYLSPEIAKSSY